MDCGDRYGDKLCIAELDGETTHGVCSACLPARMAEIDLLFSKPAATAKSAGAEAREGDAVGVEISCAVGSATAGRDRPYLLGLEEVAAICALPVARLWNLAPREWVVGVDVVLVGNAWAWRRLSLPALVGVLAVSGERAAAVALMNFLTADAPCGGELAPAGSRPQPKPTAPRVSRLAQWERDHE
jgi:hypothetical protein